MDTSEDHLAETKKRKKPKTVICTCLRHCNGGRRRSARTFNRHAPIRAAESSKAAGSVHNELLYRVEESSEAESSPDDQANNFRAGKRRRPNSNLHEMGHNTQAIAYNTMGDLPVHQSFPVRLFVCINVKLQDIEYCNTTPPPGPPNLNPPPSPHFSAEDDNAENGNQDAPPSPTISVDGSDPDINVPNTDPDSVAAREIDELLEGLRITPRSHLASRSSVAREYESDERRDAEELLDELPENDQPRAGGMPNPPDHPGEHDTPGPPENPGERDTPSPPHPPGERDTPGPDGPPGNPNPLGIAFRDKMPRPVMDHILTGLDFIQLLEEATLDNGNLDPGTREHLCSPSEHPPEIATPDEHLSIELYLALTNASEQAYEDVRSAIIKRHPDDKVLSYFQVRKLVAELSGVVAVEDDMCPNSCIAYTGPFKTLENCPTCGEPRYDPVKLTASNGHKKVPRQRVSTIPLGPQLQALRRTQEGSERAQYRDNLTQTIIPEIDADGGIPRIYKDFCHGEDYREKVKSGAITSRTFVVMFSFDGAQLFKNKASDCWIQIWVLMDLSPDLRYRKQHVLCGLVIPGPNKPGNTDSFLFTGLHHLSALMKEGLKIWDASTGTTDLWRIFIALITADGPGMALLSSLVGHQGARSCRLFCDQNLARRKPGARAYYPANQKPADLDYIVAGSDHPDLDPTHFRAGTQADYMAKLRLLMAARKQADYERLRMSTSIVKPSLFLGIPEENILGIPRVFALDLMHLIALNVTDLLLSLWREVNIKRDPTDTEAWLWATFKGRVWDEHGRAVAAATPYLPGSFDRPPRDPAEKISSGYKAWEWLMYMFGLGPALFYGVLPDAYWHNFCQLVRAVRILHQHQITREQLRDAQVNIVQFIKGFEALYCQRKAARLHFFRPCMHLLAHLPREVHRVGPLAGTAQWTMERTIGNLVEELRQPSNPYANLSQRAVRRSQVNALYMLFPDLAKPDPKWATPKYSCILGSDYLLLRKRDQNFQRISSYAAVAIATFFEQVQQGKGELWRKQGSRLRRWARLRLPNKQIARSLWKEAATAHSHLRMARNVKVCNCAVFPREHFLIPGQSISLS